MLAEIACFMAGGAAGAVLRFLSVEFAAQRLGFAAYRSIFLVNLLGCFALGLLMGFLAPTGGTLSGSSASGGPLQLGLEAAHLISLVGTGLLGGFTTFSTFALDGVVLAREKRRVEFLVDVLGTPIFGMGLAALGWAMTARWLA